MKKTAGLIATFALIAVVVCSFAGTVHADDGVASLGAGGIVVMGHEPRITMAKEVLRISRKKIAVDYDFRNDTDKDITTEVAFPIPAYALDRDSGQTFDDFSLWVNNKPVQYKTQVRALVEGKDLTPLLEEMHVDVKSFGHMAVVENDQSPEIQKLTESQRKRLEQAGLIYSDGGYPAWEVHIKYYWRQKFPAHSITHIRHTYTPVVGASGNGPSVDCCLDEKAWNKAAENGEWIPHPYSWVEFILTSANTWKTPIEDFTLIVEGGPESVSFCWDGPIKKIDANHVMAKAANFVPKRELAICF